MANNRELSQFGNFIIVNDTSKNIGVGTDVIITGVLTATKYFGDGSGLTGISTVGGSTTLSQLNVTGITTLGVVSATSLNVSGVSTFGNIVLNPAGIITAVSGVVTYYGDGSKLTGVISGVGINTAGGSVGSGATVLDFRGAGISTVTVGSGIGTIFIQGGGGAVSISSVAPTSPANGDLWYSINYGRTFVYYDEVALGIGATAVWVDAAPFNQTGSYLSIYGGNMLVGFGVTSGSSSSPSIFFNNSTNSGFYSPTSGQFGVLSSGTQILNVNPSGIVVTGIITATDFNSTSDINLKENIETIENALELTNQLRGVKFDWRKNNKPSYGVIAQELEKVLPELVSDTDTKTVNYNGIIGVLIEAVKELSAEVKQLKNNK